MREGVDHFTETRAARQLALEQYRGQVLNRAISHLDEPVAIVRTVIRERRIADGTLASDSGDLNRAAIGHIVDDRAQTRAGEIDAGLPAVRQPRFCGEM